MAVVSCISRPYLGGGGEGTVYSGAEIGELCVPGGEEDEGCGVPGGERG